MIAGTAGIATDKDSIIAAAEQAAEPYREPIPGAKERLTKVLQVMAYAHYSSIARQAAEETLSHLQ
jgi:hypothetical protein